MVKDELLSEITRRVPGLIFQELGGEHPVQGTGHFRGERVRFRYRYDDAQLYVGDGGRDANGPQEPRLYAEIDGLTGDPMSGYLDDDQLLDLLEQLVAELKPMSSWPNGTRRGRIAALASRLSQG